jgi:nicotinate-nucleotide adenylyltransferase
VASAAQRVAMLRAALAGQDRLHLDTRELDRSEPSYTIDTLRGMRAEFGAARPLILLLGVDAFAGLPTWHCWRELFDLAHIAVMTRPGHDTRLPADLAAEIAARRVQSAADLRAAPGGKVLDLPVTPLEISASAVRASLSAGRDPRWLVPDALLADPRLLAVYRDAR